MSRPLRRPPPPFSVPLSTVVANSGSGGSYRKRQLMEMKNEGWGERVNIHSSTSRAQPPFVWGGAAGSSAVILQPPSSPWPPLAVRSTSIHPLAPQIPSSLEGSTPPVALLAVPPPRSVPPHPCPELPDSLEASTPLPPFEVPASRGLHSTVVASGALECAGVRWTGSLFCRHTAP